MDGEIFGKNAVVSFLRKGAKRGTLYIARESKKHETREIESLARKKGFIIKKLPGQALDRRTRNSNHQGLLLIVEGGPAPGNKIEDWKEYLKTAIDRDERPVVALLDRVQDPMNLGAIVRSAAQFGISSLFIPNRNAAGFTPAARKAACGGDEFVQVITVSNLSSTLRELKSIGFWSAAACMDGESSLWELDMEGPFAVVMGSEGDGVKRLLQEQCDHTLCIPTTGNLESLNVSVSSALIFHEIFKQHTRSARSS